MLSQKTGNSTVIVKFLVYMIFLCSYILPIYYLENKGYPIIKFVFIAFICILYLLTLKKITLFEVFFVTGLLGLVVITKSIESLQFIGIVVLYKMIPYKNEIKKILESSNIIWVALIATIIYSFMYIGDGRLFHTSIKEINQSGLAILFLALIIRKRNLFIGNIILFLGLFTLSRTYLLAFFILLLFNIPIIKSKYITQKMIKRTSFIKVLTITSVLLLCIAFLYDYLYQTGRLYIYDSNFTRLFNFADMSNYFRFITNKNLVMIFEREPKFLLTGMTENDFFIYSMNLAKELGQAYRYTNPHNFVFSYLKIYGGFSFFVFLYISKILKKIVDEGNYSIYLTLIVYAIFLSVGFNHYWLYLSSFVLILYGKEDVMDDTEQDMVIKNNVEYI